MRVFLLRKARITAFYVTIPARHTPEAACKKVLPIRIFYPRKIRQPSTNPLKPLIFSL